MDLVRAGSSGDQDLFRRALEALITEERSKQHHVLADRLAEHLEFGAKHWRTTQERRPTLNGELSLVSDVRPQRRFDDLILPEGVRRTCEELVEEHLRADLLRAHNLEPRHRMMLVGPPGNGKTSLAEALSYELTYPMLVARYESLIGSYLGETAVRLAKLFAQVRTQRCVLFFDEFDVLGKERGDAHETGEIKRVVSSLLLQIDQLPPHVVVVSATNHGELLDRAAWRRFEVRLTLPAPGKAERLTWLRSFESRTSLRFGRSHEQLAKQLAGLSFAELEQFGEDIQRKFVLAGPEANARKIVSDRLHELATRAEPMSEGERSHDA